MKNLVQCNVPGFCNLYVTKGGKAFKIQSNNTLKELKVGIELTLKEMEPILSPPLVLELEVENVTPDKLWQD